MVNEYHGLPPVTTDGIWGQQTVSSVQYFQLHGAGLTSDGIVRTGHMAGIVQPEWAYRTGGRRRVYILIVADICSTF